MFNIISLTFLLRKNIINIIISSSIYKLGFILNYFSKKNNNNIYKSDLEKLDIELKLNIIKNWIHNKNHYKLYSESLLNLCIKIDNNINEINNKIKYHNTKLFNNWRSLNLDYEIKEIKKLVFILDHRLILINFL
jgi:hypothetical protein